MSPPPGRTVCRQTPDGVALSVRLTPKGGADRVEGIADGAEGPAVKARVSAPPEKGKANAALEKLVAGWLSLPRSSVSVSGGQKSRNKTVMISGSPETLADLVTTRLADLASGR
ncbi:MAG: DUF167 domain-containing protein [Hyphomicrobiales bacterium]|nr:DUF167 domain-containing protein [Hyphomicrobiales bacterium]